MNYDAEIVEKLCMDSGEQLPNPYTLANYSEDLSDLPNFEFVDLYNYLIQYNTKYDHNGLKAYKALDSSYRLVDDGSVEKMLYHPINEVSKYCVVKSNVKPTQRDKDKFT